METTRSTQVQPLSIDSITADPTQPRKSFNNDDLRELSDSIIANGLIQPITVRPADSGYIIVAGERRYRATQLAGLTTIDCIVREDLDGNTSTLVAQMVENTARADMNPIEEAQGYERLIASGLDTKAIATAVGKTSNGVSIKLRLLKLAPAIQEMVALKSLNTFDGNRLADLSHEGQFRALRIIEDGGLTGKARTRAIGAVWHEENQAGMFASEEPQAAERKARESRVAAAVRRAGEAMTAAAQAIDDEGEVDSATAALLAEMLKAAQKMETRAAKVSTQRAMQDSAKL